MGLKINAKLYDIGPGYKSECHPEQALRSRNAWARVPLSTYSSSPPTGTPRAIRVTLIPFGLSSVVM
jgi:hypothetical protein